MAADIEFNVRNGMTVGSSKHLVLDVNGALSGSNITVTTGGQFLSGGTDILTVLDNIGYLTTADSSNWEGTYTSVLGTSSQWDTAYTWGNHATQNYLTDYTVTESDVTAHQNALHVTSTVSNNSGDWETAHSWGDHSQQSYATTSDVSTAISNLVDSAPTTLDTLNELAAALGDDANFSTTITTSIGTKWTQDNTKISNWDTAYGWGNHATQNYLTDYTVTQSDVTAHQDALHVTTTVSNNSGDWETAHGWGNHATQNYLTDYTVSETDVTAHQDALHVTTTVSNNSGDWETAHGWGNHATQNYLTDYTVTQSDVTSHQNALHVTTTVSNNSGDWETAHSWGNHATQNYLTDYTVTQSDVTAHQDALHVTTTVSNNSGDWETAHSWGNHATQNYLTDYTVTQSDVTAHQDALHVTTTVSNNSGDWDAGIETIAAASDTDIGTPAKGELLVYTNGGTDAWQNKKDRGAIESMYNYANANHWNELTYTDDLLTKIEVYVSSSKATLLFDRTFTYDANDTLTTVTTRDMQGGSARHTLTKTYEYTASGSLSSVGRTYS